MSEIISKPVPVPDEISAPFFDGAREGRLMLQHCTACDRWSFPVRERCPHCFAARLEWRQASGRGSLYTFTIMHQVMNPGFASAVPYNVAQVDLVEGVRMTSNVVGIGNEMLRIGMPLQADVRGCGRERPHPEIPSRSRLERGEQRWRTSRRGRSSALG